MTFCPTRWGAIPAGTDPAGTDPASIGQASPTSYRFAYWAPSANEISVALNGETHLLSKADDGFHRAVLPARTGDSYRLCVDGDSVNDPTSRLQAGGVLADAVLCDGAFEWQNTQPPLAFRDAVILEVHIGTFTAQGTFAAATEKLRALAQLGITVIELLPIGQFGGHRGWGYDGVLPYAPHAAYGTPDDLKRLIDAAHGLGMLVYLDVVYNHFGPEGNYLPSWCPEFFDATTHTPWGAAIDFSQAPVRDFMIDNAVYWLEQYRFDGLRLDAIDQIRGTAGMEMLRDLARRVRAAVPHPVHLVTEDNRNISALHQAAEGLYDGEWNDDYHHAVHCLLTGEDQGYYRSFAANPLADLATALTDGYVEQGQPRPGAKSLRGQPPQGMAQSAFINFNQNHDQIGNRAGGERLLTLAAPNACKVAHALLLLSPFTPMLFMGEEYGETAPFQFFTDFNGELAEIVRKGRQEEFADFEGFKSGALPDPNAVDTFTRSKLGWTADAKAQHWRDLTRDLLNLRKTRLLPLFATGQACAPKVETAPKKILATFAFMAGTLQLSATFGTPVAAQTTGETLFAQDFSGNFTFCATLQEATE